MAPTKRDAICTAALELFAEQGIGDTTIQDIADRAGAAEGTLYRHFPGKAALVEWLFDASARRFQEALLAAVGDETEPRTRLRRLITGVFDFAQADPPAFTYLLSVHHRGLLCKQDDPPPPMRTFTDTLQAGIEQGAFRNLSPALATGWIVAMAQRAVVFLRSDVITASREQVIEETTEAALRLVDAGHDG